MATKPTLTPKQSMFVREYLVDLNATRASIRAGYSAKTAEQQGPRLLGNVGVAAAIQAAMDKRATKVEISAEYVLAGIKRVTERCETAEPVLDREGRETGEWTFQANAALKGYELLGKHLKLFTDRTEVSGPAGGAIPIDVTLDPSEAYKRLLGGI